MNKNRNGMQHRRPRAKGLIYTRCAICNQTRAHTIAIGSRKPMLRCQTCGAMRNVAQTKSPFREGQ